MNRADVMRDAAITQEVREMVAYMRVAAAASDLHDEECGCSGRGVLACDLGAALRELDEARDA